MTFIDQLVFSMGCVAYVKNYFEYFFFEDLSFAEFCKLG